MTACMVQVPLDMRAFHRWGAERGLVRGGTFDEGFALHVLLSSTFGKGVLQPFRLFASPRRAAGSLYAYSDRDGRVLAGTADTVATPDCLSVLDVRRLRTKPLPRTIRAGQRLGFDIRVRPVRRLHADARHANGNVLRRGAEVDVFVTQSTQDHPKAPAAACERSAVRRQAAYVQWLGERLDGAATLQEAECQLASFRRTRVVRGDGRGPEGPDATLYGQLTVTDPERFARCLRQGVGRHKAYGYGMLLLRPPPAGSAP